MDRALSRRSSSGRALSSVVRAWGTVALALTLGGCKGQGATGGCSGDDALCGGDSPVGTWIVTDVCDFQPRSRPAQNYDVNRGYFQPETGVPALATTSGSWCEDISFGKDGNLRNPAVVMPNPDTILSESANATSRVVFKADHTYLYILTAHSTTNFHVASSCLGVNGATLTCAQLTAKFENADIGSNPLYRNLIDGQPAFQCQAAGDGCDCSFDYLESDKCATGVGDSGTWEQDGAILHHYSVLGQGIFTPTNPSRRTVRDATFCKSGDTMVLAGANGQPLVLKTGSRTLYLKKVPDDTPLQMGTCPQVIADAGGADAGTD